MHTFHFPNGDALNVQDLSQAVAIGALSPVGTLLNRPGELMFQMKAECGWIAVSSDDYKHFQHEYQNKAEARLRRDAVARAATGVAYCVEARGKVRA